MKKDFRNKFSIDNISSTVDFRGIVLDLVWRIVQWSSFLREEDCTAIIIYPSNTVEYNVKKSCGVSMFFLQA